MKSWLKNAIFYEIYPQSFKDTNSDGIGDFEGIIEKLDYIKDIGFTAIWLNPCFDSPFNDAGYDVRDFYRAAERYGTNDDLRRLFDEAHKRGLRVVLDLVAGHTSVECEWFLESKKPEKNRYTDRYVWTDSVWKKISDIPGIAGCLIGVSDRDGTCGVNFFSSQPALNYGFAEITEPWQCAVDSEAALETRAEILNIIYFWLGLGCDGFRVDMAGSLVKNDKDQEATINLWSELLSEVSLRFPEAVFISEWGQPERALRGGYDMDFLLHFGPSHYNDMYHSVEPYFSRVERDGAARDFFEYYVSNYEQTVGNGFICLPSGNHDMPRLSYYCDNEEIKLVYAFMMSMPGVPFIYYGDEIGMRYLPNLTSVEGGYKRTGARTPMQWDDGANCGFSSAKPERLYIMQDPSSDRPVVSRELADDNSVLNELRRQIAVRKGCDALGEAAGFELISSDYPLLYKRFTDNESVLVVINPLDKVVEAQVSEMLPEATLYSLGGEAKIENGVVTAPPVSATFLRIKSK